MTQQELYRFIDIFVGDSGYYCLGMGGNIIKCHGRGEVAKTIVAAKAPSVTLQTNSYASAKAPAPMGYDWVFVSVSGQASERVANSVYSFLRDNGFEKPVILRKDDTIYLYYKTRIDPTRIEQIARFRYVLSALFTEQDAIINRETVYLQRGLEISAGTQSQLFKEWEIVRCPTEIKENKLYLFQNICEIQPCAETPCAENHYNVQFNADEFLQKHSVVAEKTEYSNFVRWRLAKCPFCEDEHPHEAYMLRFSDGTYQFVCLHPVHRAFNYRDFRLAYDRTTYSESVLAEHANKLRYYATKPFKSSPQRQRHNDIWIKLSSIKTDLMSIGDYIPSGFPELDNQFIGFQRGHVSVWCGRKGCGKSSLLNQIIINAAQRGFRTALWSGELSEKELKTWMLLQVAGRAFTQKSYFGKMSYTPQSVSQLIEPWFDKYIRLYDNDLPPSYISIEEYVRELHEKWPLDVVALDNLMAMSISELGEGSELNNQKMLLHNLTKLAAELNIHIHLAAHPAKGPEWITSDSIAGSGNIGNYAQNIFLVSRIEDTFGVQARGAIPATKIKEIIESNCSTIIQVAKCRHCGGCMGEVIKLYYEEGSGRFKSTPTEVINYNWREMCDKPLPDLPFKQ